MKNPKIEKLSKKEVIDKMLEEKEALLEDFRTNQRNKLDQASSEDIDNRHIDSKNEETLHELKLLNNNVEVLEKEILRLRNIPIDADMPQVQFGSLVETEDNVLLVAAASDSINVNGVDVIGISTSAPLYQKIDGHGPGDTYELNGARKKILAVK